MSPRLNLSLDEPVHHALAAAAALRGCRPGTLAGELLTSAIIDHPHREALPQDPHRQATADTDTDTDATLTDPDAPPRERTPWLQLDRGRDWQHEMWNLVEGLRHDYPSLGSTIDTNWHTRRFTRDGLIALAVWRAELDAGTQTDPRLEHQWLNALRDFERHHDDIRRSLRGTVERHEEPDAWPDHTNRSSSDAPSTSCGDRTAYDPRSPRE